jgi:hypothetical protein
VSSRRPSDAGLKAGGAGITVANKAQPSTPTTSKRARRPGWRCSRKWPNAPRRSSRRDAKNPNAWYWQAYALGRYSQGISVAKALAQGLGSKVKTRWNDDQAAPKHADAHIALGAFHAEVIDKVGKLLGRTQGADAGHRA